MKQKSIIIGIAGLVFLVSSFLLPSVIGALFLDNPPSVGIIGGADSPTAEFLTRQLFRYTDLTLKFFGGALFITGLAGFLFGKSLDEICPRRTTLLSLAISADLALAANALLLFLSCFFLTNPSSHPTRLPASLILGLVSLGVLLLLLSRYVESRKVSKSGKGIAVDVGITLLYFTPFFFLFTSVFSMLTRV